MDSNKLERDDYHPDPKAASTLHSSDAELEQIVAKSDADEPTKSDASKPAKGDADQPVKAKSTSAPVRHRQISKPLRICFYLLCGVLAILLITFILWRGNPDSAVQDALYNFIAADKISTSGTIHLELPYDTNFYDEDFDRTLPAIAKDITINLEGATDGIQSKSKASIHFITADDDEYDLELEHVFTKDGVLYFQLNNLAEAYKNVEFDILINSITRQFKDTVSLVADGWWKLDLPAIVEEDQRSDYACMIGQLNFVSANAKQLKEFYQAHPFLSTESYHGKEFKSSYGNSLYELKLDDTDQLNEFFVALDSSDILSELSACAKTFNISPIKFITNLTYRLTSDEATTQLVLEVNDWNHQIVGLHIASSDEDGAKTTTSLKFSYPASLDFATPADAADAKPIFDQFQADAVGVNFSYFYIDYAAQ